MLFAGKTVLHLHQRLTKALIMYDLPFPQKAQGILYAGVIGEIQQMIIGNTSLLLCRHIFCQIGNGIIFCLNITGSPGNTVGVGIKQSQTVLNKLGFITGFDQLFLGGFIGQLIGKGGDDLQMSQFFGTQRLSVRRKSGKKCQSKIAFMPAPSTDLVIIDAGQYLFQQAVFVCRITFSICREIGKQRGR